MVQPIESQVETLRAFLDQSCSSGRCPVLWIGAGVSAAAGYPTLAGIETLLRPRLPDSFASGFALVDEFTAESGQDGLAALFAQSLGEPRPCAPIHNAVARLAGDGILRILFTTNYDRLIENTLATAGVPFVAERLEEDSVLEERDRVQVLRLHDGLDDWHDVFLAIASLEAFEESYPRLVHHLDQSLRRRPVLFVGCSLSDPRLLDWLAALPVPDRRDLIGSRAILTREEWGRLPAPKRQLFASANLQPVLVEDHDGVVRLLEGLAERDL